MKRQNPLKLTLSLVLATLLVACGRAPMSETSTNQWKVSGDEYNSKLNSLKTSKGFTTSTHDEYSEMVSRASEFTAGQTGSVQDAAVRELMAQAALDIQNGLYSGSNVYAVGIGYRDAGVTCAYVQVQQRSKGRLLVRDTRTLSGQPTSCGANPGNLPFGIVAGFFGKAGGNNYIGGIGAGVGWFSAPYLKGCVAGAAGYASQTFSVAAGVVGATCGAIALY